MGSGASSPEADAQLKKWENAVSDLSQLCQDQRRALGMPFRSRANNSDDKEAELRQSFRNRRTSSLVSFEARDKLSPQQEFASSEEGKGGHPNPPHIPTSPKPDGRRHGTQAEFSVPHSTSPSQRERNLAREQIVQIKKARTDIFKSYEPEGGEGLDDVEGAHRCNHYAVVAAGLSALLGGAKNETDRKKRVTVEDLFFAAQIPLVSLNSDVAHLTEIYDVVREFIDVDNRFKEKYVAECVHLDIAPVVGQVEMEGNEVGDRQPRVSLPDFRKHITTELEEDSDSVRFLYYDPYLVQQAMSTEEDDDEGGESKSESDVGEGLAMSITRKDTSQKKVTKGASGHLSALVDIRVGVQPMITIAEAAASDVLFTHLHEVPLQAMYKAMKAPQMTGRAGGYIRVTLKGTANNKEKEEVKDDVTPFFSPELCSGKVLGSKLKGNDAHCTSALISSHISAVAWAFHFLAGSQPHNHNHGDGLPTTQIIRELQLPLDIFMKCSLTVEQVYMYVTQYLESSGLDQQYRATLCPILTKAGRADAPPTLSVFDLEAVLIDVKSVNIDPEQPSHLMILQYDANIAHNVLGVSRYPQWCVLIGYDEDLQLARVVDANAVSFSGSWNISLERLHKAITNYGYIMLGKLRVNRSLQPQSLGASVSSREGSPRHSSVHSNQSGDRTPVTTGATAEEIGALRHVNSILQARFDLLEEQPAPFPVEDVLPNFAYPPEPLCITQLGVALSRLGHLTTVEALLHRLPYDISSLISAPLSIHSMALLARDYAETVEGLFLKTQVYHADRSGFHKSLLLSDFVRLMQNASDNSAKEALLVNFDRDGIHIFGARNPSGEYALLLHYDRDTNMATLADSSPNRFFRVWKVMGHILHDAVYRTPGNYRSRGCIVLSKLDQPEPKPDILSRYCNLHVVPLQNTFAVSPSPQIQALSFGFAQLGYYFSPEEIFYEAYLKTMTDQRRRGSQAFAWRDVEISLRMVSKINADTTMKVAKKFLESRKVGNIIAEVLEDMDDEDLESVFEENEVFGQDTKCVLLANYKTEVVHGVQHMGPSMAIVKSYNPETKKVGLFESEHSRFGLEWEADATVFIEACDLQNEGKSDYGIVKLAVGENKPRVGFGGFNAFGANNDSEQTLDAPVSHVKAKSPRAVFLDA